MEKQGSTTTGTYTYGEDLIRKGSETLLYDGQGNLRCSTNASQTLVDTANPDAFGKTIGSTGSTASPFQFGATSAYQNWGDVGLYHVGARSYDPQVGRFISRDTYLDQNPYLYCEHDPVNGLDPTGHQTNGKEILHKMWGWSWTFYGGWLGSLFGPGGTFVGGLSGVGFGEWSWQVITDPNAEAEARARMDDMGGQDQDRKTHYNKGWYDHWGTWHPD